VRVHDLRHTVATLMLAKGVPMKMVQEILGHSTHQFTIEIHGHVVEEMRDETSAALDQDIRRGSGKPRNGSPNGSPTDFRGKCNNAPNRYKHWCPEGT
jgi:Phage integrase family